MARTSPQIATGYFGVPGTNAVTKTHVVVNGEPVCGSRLRSGMEFQFCAAGVWSPYVECRRCLGCVERLIDAERAAAEAAEALTNGKWRKR